MYSVMKLLAVLWNFEQCHESLTSIKNCEQCYEIVNIIMKFWRVFLNF